MKYLLLPFVLSFSSAVLAQDTASVSALMRDWDRAILSRDGSWFLDSFDPTCIGRTQGELWTYAAVVEEVEAERKGKLKRDIKVCETSVTRVQIVGERAIVDYTGRYRELPTLPKEVIYTGRLILVWKNGAWKIWRTDESFKPAK